MADFFESIDELVNPLDRVEDVLSAHDWTFDRMTDDELMVVVRGKSGAYRLFFVWQGSMNAMQFCCQYDFRIPEYNYDAAAMTLMNINENTWMGHFDMPRESGTPSFRHTCLLRGLSDTGNEYLEDMVDIALALCERYYPVFSLLAAAKPADNGTLSLALMDPAGES